MADLPLKPKQSRNWTGFVLWFLLIVAISAILWQKLKHRPSSGGERFDPAGAVELIIKGSAPEGALSWSAIAVPESPPLTDALVAHGRQLFEQACAGCHGSNGAGDGPLQRKRGLSTNPANLTQPIDSIKIRSTLTGSIPLDDDLFRTLTRGLPGTDMLSYRALSADDRWALVHFIKTIAPPGTWDVPPVKIDGFLKSLGTAKTDAITREAGATVYRNICQNCHGAEGLGGYALLDDPATGKPYPGLRFARNGGLEMLGGSSEADIARTLLAGFHNKSPMLSFKPYFYDEEHPPTQKKVLMDQRFWGTVHHVRSLIERAK